MAGPLTRKRGLRNQQCGRYGQSVLLVVCWECLWSSLIKNLVAQQAQVHRRSQELLGAAHVGEQARLLSNYRALMGIKV